LCNPHHFPFSRKEAVDNEDTGPCQLLLPYPRCIPSRSVSILKKRLILRRWTATLKKTLISADASVLWEVNDARDANGEYRQGSRCSSEASEPSADDDSATLGFRFLLPDAPKILKDIVSIFST
jgi:hypothetical protein